MLHVQQFVSVVPKQPFNLFVGLNDTAFTIDNEDRTAIRLVIEPR